MKKIAISEGDRVNVFFENLPWITNASVLYIPQATGDCWKLILEDDPFKGQNKLIYVQNFAKMECIQGKQQQ